MFKKSYILLMLAASMATGMQAQCCKDSGCKDGCKKACKAKKMQYPMTKTMGNPLFVDFPSEMWGTDSIGDFYSADASAHVWNIDGKEVLYVYCSHDMEPARGCDRMDRYHVFSTTDMKTWTDHGEILNSADAREQTGEGVDGFMWAPDAAYNPQTGLYYFYFPHPAGPKWFNSWKTYVATSKYPDRDFKIVGEIKGAPSEIDPCVFIDDDGQPYFYNGGGRHIFGCKMRKDDWTKLDGEPQPMEGLEDFHEGAWVFKKDGKYYMSYPDNKDPKLGGNQMRHAVSDSPLGPWKSLGVYIESTGTETQHGSVVKFKGKWYAFYHVGNWSGYGNLRSVCVDRLEFNRDGSFKTLKQTWGHAPETKKKMIHP